MVHTDRVKLSQLKLDTANYRLGPTASQRDTVKALINDQKRKLVNHARDLLTMGLSPGEFVWVMPDPKDSKMFVVLEGNRRVAALKLLETPGLADGTGFDTTFRQMSRKYLENPVKEVEARVFKNRIEARPWIRRRHLKSASGVGLETWKPAAKARALRDEGESAPRFLAVIEALDDGTEAWAEIESALDDRWTTVDRVLNSASMPKILGIQIHPRNGKIDIENGNERAGKALLQRILSVMASPQFKFESIENKRDREKFIGGFADWSVKRPGRVGQQATKPVKAEIAKGSRSTESRPRISKDSKERATLAPSKGSRVFSVENPRLNGLYRECREIKVLDHENAAALLLRVFIELSSEALLIDKGVALTKRLQNEGKHSWSDIGVPLHVKVDCVCDYLDPSKKAKTFQQARLAAQPSSRSTYSIFTLHSYFHNLKFIPDADEIKGAWDAWEAYLFDVHNALAPRP